MLFSLRHCMHYFKCGCQKNSLFAVALISGLGHYNSVSTPTLVKGDIEGEKIVSVHGKGDCVLAVSGTLWTLVCKQLSFLCHFQCF